MQKNLKTYQDLGDRWGTAFTTGSLGFVAYLSGNHEKAHALLSKALSLHLEMGNKLDISFSLETHACFASTIGQYKKAAILWGFTNRLRESMHAKQPPSYAEDFKQFRNLTIQNMGKEAFEAAQQEGRTMKLDEATKLALNAPPQSILRDAKTGDVRQKEEETGAKQYGLSPREIEILCLVADGLTDMQIGETLFISPRTVSKHLQSIYRKINVNSRSAATRFALEKQIT